MSHEFTNRYSLTADPNTYSMQDVNTYNIFDFDLPDKYKPNSASTIIGGKDIKRISLSAREPRVGGRGGFN